MNEPQIDKWRDLLDESRADEAAWTRWKIENQKRTVICAEMVDFLTSYLAGQCDTEKFRDVFDRKTRTEWSLFGFKGMSGAMFLNKLVKHIPDVAGLTAELRTVLPVPGSTDEGRSRMKQFASYLAALIKSGQITKGQMQPARLPYFASAWWHVQGIEHWPVYYPSGRKVLEQEGEFTPAGDPVDDYFAFRDVFLALAKGIGLGSWDFEHLLDWHDKQPASTSSDLATLPGKGTVAALNMPVGTTAVPAIESIPDDDDGGEEPSQHAHAQWLLARIGQKLGCKVWIASNDQGHEWKGQKLGSLSIKELPTLGLDAESQKTIRLIDVVWLKGANQVAAAFEIEHTTSIYSGILRMADLVAQSPNLNFPLYLVAPEKRLDKVRAQLSRPTFQILELHKRCGYFSTEALVEKAESIMQWATSPAAIEKLAAKVEDIRLA